MINSRDLCYGRALDAGTRARSLPVGDLTLAHCSDATRDDPALSRRYSHHHRWSPCADDEGAHGAWA